MGRALLFLTLCLSAQVVRGQLLYGQNRDQGALDVDYTSPKKYIVAGIRVVGGTTLDESALVAITGIRVGDEIEIPGDVISRSLKRLWEQGIVDDISLSVESVKGQQLYLVLEIKERARLTKYTFHGISKTQISELEQDVELTKGRILTKPLEKKTENIVRKYFLEKGFLNAEVRTSQRADTAAYNGASLHIHVNSGKRVRIKEIEFRGNRKVSNLQLRSSFKKTGKTPYFKIPSSLFFAGWKLVRPKNMYRFVTQKDTTGGIAFSNYIERNVQVNVFKPSKFLEKEYQADKENLLRLYNSLGYRDMEIVQDTSLLLNKKHLKLVVDMFEGNRYYFGKIVWKGNYIFGDATLDRMLGIQEGDIYDKDRIDKKLNFDPQSSDVSSLYMDRGHLFFRVDAVETAVRGDTLDLEMRIFEGDPATLNKVTLVGNDKTSDHVVLREIRTYPGDQFSRSQLIRSQRELSQLGYFDPQKVAPVPKPNPVNQTVDIEWGLEEQTSDQIELSGGWGGAIGFVGTLGVSFNNFSSAKLFDFSRYPPVGDGQRLSLRAQSNGPAYQSYSFGFSEPWLGGRKPNHLNVNVSYSIQRLLSRTASGNLRAQARGSFKVIGLTTSLGRRLTWPDDYFILSNSISYYHYILWNFTNRLGFRTGSSNNLTFNTTLARNSSDNPTYPQVGSDLSLSIDLSPPYSLWNNLDYATADNKEKFKWVEYYKANLDFRYYVPVVSKLVLAPRVHFGFIGSYSKEATIGPFNRFVLGGDGLTGQNFLLGTDVIGLRGYPNPNTSLAGPSSLTPYDRDLNILGGTLFTKYVLELRYPLSLAPTSTIYVLVFLEGGNNWNDPKLFNPYDVYKSAGVGARIFLPAFGLLGLDYGYGFDAIPGSFTPSAGQFHFSLGRQTR